MAKNENGAIQVIIAIVLFLALVIGVFLIQRQTTIKSRASSNLIQAFDIKDANDKEVNCDGSKNPPECNITTQEISIKVKDLELLTK